MKRLREGGRLKLQETPSDEMDDEDLDKLLSDAGIPEDVVQDMSREEKKSNCNDILSSNAELKNQTTDKDNTDSEEKEQDLCSDKKQETREKPKTTKRKRKNQLSLQCKKNIQENESSQVSYAKLDSTTFKDEERGIALMDDNLEITETQPPVRKIKRGKKSHHKVSESLKHENDDVPMIDEDCDGNLVLAPNTERSPTWQRSPTGLPEQIISESELSSSPQESVNISKLPDLSKGKVAIVRFTPDGVVDPSVYTQVIKLMFDIYIHRLRMATAKCNQNVKEKWGNPVCCGFHSKNSLKKDPRQDEENYIEARDRPKRYATRNLNRGNIGTDLEMETEVKGEEMEKEIWNFVPRRSQRDVEISSRREEDRDFDIHSSASPISESEVMQSGIVTDSSSENREDSDYDPYAKQKKKSRNCPKSQKEKKTSLKLCGKKKASHKKQIEELFSRGDDHEVKEDTSIHLLASEESQVKMKKHWNDKKYFGVHSKNSSKKDSTEEEENIETGDKTKCYARRNLRRNGAGMEFQMESEVSRVDNKERLNIRSGRSRKDEGPSLRNREEAHSPTMLISDSQMKQYDIASYCSNENRDSDDDPCPKRQKKSKSLPNRSNQVASSLELGGSNKAIFQKEQIMKPVIWNDDSKIKEDSSSQRSSSKKHQEKANTMTRSLNKSETSNVSGPDDEVEGVSSGADGAIWLSKEGTAKHNKGNQEKDASKAYGIKSYNNRCEPESRRRFSKKRKINADVTWMDVESKNDCDVSENYDANPVDGIWSISEENSKDSSTFLSGKSSKTIKSSTDESRCDVDGTSKEQPDNPSVEVISLPEDTLNPGMVNDTMPDSQSSGFLLDSNGDMYCTQINKDSMKRLSRSKENIHGDVKNMSSLCETQVLDRKKGPGKKSKKISKVGKDRFHRGETLLNKDSPEMKRRKQTKLDCFAEGTLQVSKQGTPSLQERMNVKAQEISSSGSSNDVIALDKIEEEKDANKDDGCSPSETSSIKRSLLYSSKKKKKKR